jgi:hypothetical protein
MKKGKKPKKLSKKERAALEEEEARKKVNLFTFTRTS